MSESDFSGGFFFSVLAVAFYFFFPLPSIRIVLYSVYVSSHESLKSKFLITLLVINKVT